VLDGGGGIDAFEAFENYDASCEKYGVPLDASIAKDAKRLVDLAKASMAEAVLLNILASGDLKKTKGERIEAQMKRLTWTSTRADLINQTVFKRCQRIVSETQSSAASSKKEGASPASKSSSSLSAVGPPVKKQRGGLKPKKEV
jgi:hypothetical protein